LVMARWKARAEFLLSVIELLFYLLRLRRYKAKCVKTRCLQEWVGHLLSNGVNCTVLGAVVLTQYRRVTDRQTDRRTDGRTDGIAVANTALAMRALRAL